MRGVSLQDYLRRSSLKVTDRKFWLTCWENIKSYVQYYFRVEVLRPVYICGFCGSNLMQILSRSRRKSKIASVNRLRFQSDLKPRHRNGFELARDESRGTPRDVLSRSVMKEKKRTRKNGFDLHGDLRVCACTVVKLGSWRSRSIHSRSICTCVYVRIMN